MSDVNEGVPAGTTPSPNRPDHLVRIAFPEDLYALPEALICLLAGEVDGELPDGELVRCDFLNSEDAAREREIVSAAGGGQGRFLGQPFRYPPIASSPEDHAAGVVIPEAPGERLELEMNASALNRAFEASRENQAEVGLRFGGYAGWLISNPGFRKELSALREGKAEYVESRGRFPGFTTPPVGERPTFEGDWAFRDFYLRWGLHTLVTWELPLPMWPNVGAARYEETALRVSGVTLFLPWYLFRDGTLSLSDLATHLKVWQNLEHLEEWLAKPTGDRRLGPKAYFDQLKIYCYWDLALAARYRERLERNVEAVNRVLAAFMGLGSDSVRKLRQDLRRAQTTL